MEWININERLPTINEPVLVFHTGNYPKSFGNMQICYLRDMGFYEDEPELDWANSDCAFRFDNITHWMPLPTSPINK